jgi:hypothetical protein
VQIYIVVQDQLIVGMNGPIGLNQQTIHEAMRLYGIENKRDCFEKVLRLGRHFVKEQHEEISLRAKK